MSNLIPNWQPPNRRDQVAKNRAMDRLQQQSDIDMERLRQRFELRRAALEWQTEENIMQLQHLGWTIQVGFFTLNNIASAELTCAQQNPHGQHRAVGMAEVGSTIATEIVSRAGRSQR